MKSTFFCPYCKGRLNVSNNIVFSVKTDDNRVGLVFLNPKLGDYHTTTHPSFNISEGELVEFYCPVCHANLAALEFGENLVKVYMMNENQKVYEILFSGIAGEHCTYILKDREIEHFGEDYNKYTNYFGEKYHLE